jgi:hypothetical protein
MGLLAMGIRAFGFSSGLAVNVGNDDPGPHRMMAWKPGAGIERACGIAGNGCKLEVTRVRLGPVLYLFLGP